MTQKDLQDWLEKQSSQTNDKLTIVGQVGVMSWKREYIICLVGNIYHYKDIEQSTPIPLSGYRHFREIYLVRGKNQIASTSFEPDIRILR